MILYLLFVFIGISILSYIFGCILFVTWLIILSFLSYASEDSYDYLTALKDKGYTIPSVGLRSSDSNDLRRSDDKPIEDDR